MKRTGLFFLCFMVSAFMFGQGLITNFTEADETPLVTRGDFVLRGSVLVQYQGQAEDVIIPANLRITEIGDNAFSKTGITSVVIPEGVQRIEQRAFFECYDLASVTIPNSVKVLNSEAFYSCHNLKNISLPDNLLIIGNSVFLDSGIDSIIIPKAVTAILYNAFGYGISSITIPADVLHVDDYAGNGRFGTAYNANARKAGTYTYGFGAWYFGTTVTAPPSVEFIPGTAHNAELKLGNIHLYHVAIPRGNTKIIAYTEGGLDTTITLYDAAGKYIAYDDDSGTNYNAKISPSHSLSSGVYFIKVGRYGDAAGSYTMHVTTE